MALLTSLVNRFSDRRESRDAPLSGATSSAMTTIAELMDLAEIPMMQDYGDHLKCVFIDLLALLYFISQMSPFYLWLVRNETASY